MKAWWTAATNGWNATRFQQAAMVAGAGFDRAGRRRLWAVVDEVALVVVLPLHFPGGVVLGE